MEACQKYGEVLVKLENLKTEAEQHYDADFMKFCQEQGLSSSLETNDMVLGIFKNKEKVKEYFSNNDNMENLKSFADGFKKMVDVGKSRDEIQNEVLADVGENIKDDLAKILMDDKIRTMLLSQPDNYALKAKFFDILPNINLLKGFKVKKEVNGKEIDFMRHLDNYIGLIKDRQKEITSKLQRKDIESGIEDIDRRIVGIDSLARRYEFLKENFKERREHYSNIIEKIKIRRKGVTKTKNYWQQKLLGEREIKNRSCPQKSHP